MENSSRLRDATITALASQKRQKSRVSIFLDGEFAFGLDEEIVARHRLEKGAVLTVAAQERLLFEEDYKKALNRVFRWLGQRNYTEHEIRRKLETLQFHAGVVERVFARCRELGYLDDVKFARDFVRAQMSRRALGVSRLRVELLRKGISAKVADDIFGEVFDGIDAVSFAEKAAEKFLARRGKTTPADKLRKRLADHLLRAGFSWDDVRRSNAWKKLSKGRDDVE